jgi:hypothetical protein
MSDVPANIQSAGPVAVAHYRKMIQAGNTHRFAEMCALQSPPGTKGTDRAVMERRYDGQWLDKMPKHQALRIVNEARAAGVNISGKYYMSGLADKRGHCDPAAWIESAADIRKVARERNLNVRGIVDHEAVKMEPRKSPALSERLVREMSKKEMRANPKLSKGEARELVLDKYVPRHKKKK